MNVTIPLDTVTIPATQFSTEGLTPEEAALRPVVITSNGQTITLTLAQAEAISRALAVASKDGAKRSMTVTLPGVITFTNNRQ